MGFCAVLKTVRLHVQGREITTSVFKIPGVGLGYVDIVPERGKYHQTGRVLHRTHLDSCVTAITHGGPVEPPA